MILACQRSPSHKQKTSDTFISLVMIVPYANSRMKKNALCWRLFIKNAEKANPGKNIGQSSQNTIYVKVERDFYSEQQQQQTSCQSCFVLKVRKYLLIAPFNNASTLNFNV